MLGALGGITGATVKPESDSTVIFGKEVSELQSLVEVSGNSITGTLNYVTDYTGYSSDPALQSGNFLALKFEAPEDVTVKVGLSPSQGSGMVELDSDMNAVFRIYDNETQVLKVETSKGSETHVDTYDLTYLLCEEE